MPSLSAYEPPGLRIYGPAGEMGHEGTFMENLQTFPLTYAP